MSRRPCASVGASAIDFKFIRVICMKLFTIAVHRCVTVNLTNILTTANERRHKSTIFHYAGIIWFAFMMFRFSHSISTVAAGKMCITFASSGMNTSVKQLSPLRFSLECCLWWFHLVFLEWRRVPIDVWKTFGFSTGSEKYRRCFWQCMNNIACVARHNLSNAIKCINLEICKHSPSINLPYFSFRFSLVTLIVLGIEVTWKANEFKCSFSLVKMYFGLRNRNKILPHFGIHM